MATLSLEILANWHQSETDKDQTLIQTGGDAVSLIAEIYQTKERNTTTDALDIIIN